MAERLRSDSPAMTSEVGNPFLQSIIAHGSAYPSLPFVTGQTAEGCDTTTWRSFLENASRVACILGKTPRESGAVVFIILKSGPDLYSAFLGSMLAGCVPSFLPFPNVKQDANRYWEQHRQVFQRTDPAAIIVYDDLLSHVSSAVSGLKTEVISQTSIKDAETSSSFTLPSYDDIALLQHSSGTTGLKKGVSLSYRAIDRQIEAYSESLRASLTSGATIASWLPLYHDMGLFTSFLMPMRMGIPVISIDPFEWVAQPVLLLDAIERHAATHVWLPNFAFLHTARVAPKNRKWNLSSVRALISCSEPCKSQTFDVFYGKFRDSNLQRSVFHTCYAMAETVFAISQSGEKGPASLSLDRDHLQEGAQAKLSAQPDAVTLLSNGAPIRGVDVRILRDGQFVGELEIGEICVKADFLFSGYHREPLATEAAFVDGWFRTGDLGFKSDGEIFISGRLKDLIIMNGKNILSHDVEAAVLLVQGIKAGRAVAFGLFQELVGSESLVVVAEHDGSDRSTTEIMKDVNHAIIDEIGVAPSIVRIVQPDWLIKTTSGKISRSENKIKYIMENNK